MPRKYLQQAHALVNLGIKGQTEKSLGPLILAPMFFFNALPEEVAAK